MTKDILLAVDTGVIILVLSVLLALLRRLSLVNKNLLAIKSAVVQLDFYQRQILLHLSQELNFQLKDSFPVSEFIERFDDKDTGF